MPVSLVGKDDAGNTERRHPMALEQGKRTRNFFKIEKPS